MDPKLEAYADAICLALFPWTYHKKATSQLYQAIYQALAQVTTK